MVMMPLLRQAPCLAHGRIRTNTRKTKWCPHPQSSHGLTCRWRGAINRSPASELQEGVEPGGGPQPQVAQKQGRVPLHQSHHTQGLLFLVFLVIGLYTYDWWRGRRRDPLAPPPSPPGGPILSPQQSQPLASHTCALLGGLGHQLPPFWCPWHLDPSLTSVGTEALGEDAEGKQGVHEAHEA